MARHAVPLALAVILMNLFAAGASAQTGRYVSLGVGIGFREYIEDQFETKNPSFSPLYRLSLHPKETHTNGWKLEPNLTAGYTRTRTNMDINGVETRLGRLKQITVLAGGGPSYRWGATKAGFSVMAGPSFNDFSIDDGARNAFLASDQTLNSVEAKTALAVRSGISVWHDLSRWIGLHGSVSYLYHRPDVEVTIDGVTTSEEWKTDRVSVVGGFAVGIF